MSRPSRKKTSQQAASIAVNTGMKRIFALPVTFLLAAAGCTDDGASEFASLYDPPSGGTTTSLYGTWGGAVNGLDTRWVLESNQLTLANRCTATNQIVGVTVTAEVNDTQIRILESKNAKDGNCFVNATPGTMTVCRSEPFLNCFVHSAKDLSLYNDPVTFIKLTKIED